MKLLLDKGEFFDQVKYDRKDTAMLAQNLHCYILNPECLTDMLQRKLNAGIFHNRKTYWNAVLMLTHFCIATTTTNIFAEDVFVEKGIKQGYENIISKQSKQDSISEWKIILIWEELPINYMWLGASEECPLKGSTHTVLSGYQTSDQRENHSVNQPDV